MSIRGVMHLILVGVAVSACSLPRGAANQSQVLAEQRDESGRKVESDFDVVAVNRTTLARVGKWPAVGPGNPGWLGRKQQPSTLFIAAGDVVHITVWDADENSLITSPGQKAVNMQAMKIAATGDVFLPFVGRIKLAGMTPDAARARVEEAYLAVTPSAQVQLSVEPGRANTANLVAGVANPGVYPLADRDVTILALLAMGGGVNPNLANPQVKLFRGSKAYGIALDRLYDEPSLDTTLQGGDRVIVEAESRVFLSLGSAGSQSRHIFPKENLTALEALAIIGGVKENRADPKGVLILRNYPANAVRADGQAGPTKQRMVFVIDLTTADGMFSAGNFRVMPDDLVYATESPVNAARTVMGLIGAVFGLANQASN